MTKPLSIAVAALLIAFMARGASAVPEQDPPEHPFLTYEHPHDWTMRVTLRVRSWQDTRNRPVRTESWTFDTVAVLFPLMEQTSASRLDIETTAGKLTFGDRLFADSFTVIGGYHSGQKYARFDAQSVDAREMELEVEYLARSWRTEFDEAAARRIGWPTGEWPEEVAGTLQPQPFVEAGPAGNANVGSLDRLMKSWTDGQNPKNVPPLTLAKWFAGRVIEHVQLTSDGLNRGRRYLGFEGFSLQGAARTAQTGRGSPYDAVALLAAMYRRAGLPARVVIAYREVDDNDDPDEADDKGASRLRAYVEFYLHDEQADRGGWIPVDIVEMRKRSSRAPTNLDEPWRYFGTHDELDLFIPMSFNFHPPTTVRAYGSPAMWGWFVTPTPPDLAYQYLNFTAFRTPQRAGGPVLPGER